VARQYAVPGLLAGFINDSGTRTEAVDGDREAQIVERFIARKFGAASASTAPSTVAHLKNPASDKENVNDDHDA